MSACPSFNLSCDNISCNILYCCGSAKDAEQQPADNKARQTQTPQQPAATVPPHHVLAPSRRHEAHPPVKLTPPPPPPEAAVPHPIPCKTYDDTVSPALALPPRVSVPPKVYELPAPPPRVQVPSMAFDQPAPHMTMPLHAERMPARVPSKTYQTWTPPPPPVPYKAYDQEQTPRKTGAPADVPSKTSCDGVLLLPETQPPPATAVPPHHVPYKTYEQATEPAVRPSQAPPPATWIAPRASQYPPAPRLDDTKPHMEYYSHAHQEYY